MADSDRLTVDNVLRVPRVDADEHVLVCVLVDQFDNRGDAGSFFQGSGRLSSDILDILRRNIFGIKILRQAFKALKTLKTFKTCKTFKTFWAFCSRSLDLSTEFGGSESELLFDEVCSGLEGLTDLVPALAALSQDSHTALVVKSSDLA